MQPIDEQPEGEDHLQVFKSQLKAPHRLTFPLLTIHQLDCIYYGEINKSYQREGFGILQSLNF